ncbi:MAG: hypothetical protein KDC73_11650 [Ignavibacteriae bacterium]|nr:hypothetical protein [Ignavibacteriota bacterium]MCB9243504.1 hypothetical protein [Ignavibacteriales bacterium]
MIFVKDYIAMYPTDITYAFEQAILAAQNGGEEQILVLEDRGVYTIEETLSVDGLTILGNGSKLIFDFSSAGIGLTALGSLGTQRAIDSVAVRGTNFVECSGISTDGLETGDLVLIYSDKFAGDGIKVGELKRVKLYKDSKVYFDDYLFDTYELVDPQSVSDPPESYNLSIAKVNATKLKIFDLEIEFPRIEPVCPVDPQVEDYLQGIYVEYCDNAVISNVKFNNSLLASIALYNCYNPLVDKCEVDNSNLFGYGYGVMIGNACSYPKVRDSNFVGIRHAIRCGGLTTVKGGKQWEVNIENVTATVTTPQLGEHAFVFASFTGSVIFKNCTAIGGIPDSQTAIKYTGVGIGMKGNVLIENFRALNLNGGVDFYTNALEGESDSSLIERANIVIKNMYTENVVYPVFIGGNSDTYNIDMLNIDGLASVNDGNNIESAVITIQTSSIKKWNFNNINCYNKTMFTIREQPLENPPELTLPQVMEVNNSSVIYTDDITPTFFMRFLNESPSNQFCPVKQVIFNNLYIDGSKLVYPISLHLYGSQEDLGLIFNNCVLLNLPSNSKIYNLAKMNGIEFNNCVCRVDDSVLIEVIQDMDYISVTNSVFLGTQSSSLVDCGTAHLTNLFHSGNYLYGNTLLSGSPGTTLEKGDF